MKHRFAPARMSRASLFGLWASLVLGATACTNDGEGGDSPPPPQDRANAAAAVQESVGRQASGEVAEKRDELLSGAVEALERTEEAAAALQNGDGERALQALAAATGQLDIILAREPSLALAPVDVSAIHRDLVATVEEVEQLRDRIEDLVEDGRLQEARLLMESFGSEVRVRTTNLPLATYPQAMKDAARLIDQGRLEEARAVLDTALSTLVVEEEVVPLPLLRAQAMLDRAQQQLSGKADRTSTAGTNVASLLDNASYQTELAQALGYGDDQLYDGLEREIEELQERVTAKEDSGDLFDSIKRRIQEIRSSIRNEIG